MLINSDEYQAMFDTEEKLWRYKILHEKVCSFLTDNHYPLNTKILDAGCGTGGLISFLSQKGFTDIKGFDFSEDAVALSRSRGFDVIKLDITRLKSHYTDQTFDVIICNDVLYQFDDHEIEEIFKGFFSKLKPGGIIISNNNAFKVFYGTHDIAVGSKRRFTLKDFREFSHKTSLFKIYSSTYWSLLLSPLILFVRSIQRLQLRMGLIDLTTIKSDVEMPSPLVNTLLYKLVKLEGRLFNKIPFGSSLFLVLKKM